MGMVPIARRVPLSMAKFLGSLAADVKLFPIFLIVFAWVVCPGILFGLSVVGMGAVAVVGHKGKEFVDKYAKDGSLPDHVSTDNAVFKCILQLLKDSIPGDNTKNTQMAKACHGVSEETTTGVHRSKEMAVKGELLSPVTNVKDCVTKFKFSNVCGCKHPLPDSIMHTADVMIGGKRAL